MLRPAALASLRPAAAAWLVALTLPIPSFLAAQPRPRPQPVGDADRKAAIQEIGRLLNEKYVFPEVGQKAGAALAAKEKEGAYAQLDDPFDFADALTRDLQAATRDKHLRVGLQPPPPPPGAAPAGPPPPQRAENHGFKEVRILPGNLGYVRLDGFLPPQAGGRTAVAALEFLSGADALIFDLRQNGGGHPGMVQLLSSFLFEEPTHLNDLYWREGEQRDQFWTLPWTPVQPRPEVPVYVLTSGRTFSAAEEFTHNLKALKRATIVGETTGGGANPGRGFDVGTRFMIFVPTGRAINPTTGGNWEGTGIEPDIKTEAKNALLAAQSAALEALAAKAKKEEEAARLRFARLFVVAELQPFVPDASRLAAYAGSYGPRRVTLENGELFYQREGRPRLRMRAIAEDVFALEGVDDFLARFEKDAAGKLTRLVGLYADGSSDESPRSAG
jgi:hypothetical protein